MALNVFGWFYNLSLNHMTRGFIPGLNRTYYIDTWIDSFSIPLGTEWRQEITKGITASHVLVLVASAAHYSEYVAEEIGIAKTLNRPVFPL